MELAPRRYYIIWNHVRNEPHFAFQNGLGPVLYPDYDMAKRKMGELTGHNRKYFKIDKRVLRYSKNPQEGFSLCYEIVHAELFVSRTTS